MTRQGANKKAARGDAVVSKILDCALAELAESGYGGVSLERVAERAGVAKTTVWRRWPTKAELVASAFQAHIARIVGDEPEGPLRPNLLAILRKLTAHLTSDLGRGLFSALASECGSDELGAILRQVREQSELLPRRVIKRAIERGELPAHVDATLTFDMLVGALKHRIFHARRPVGDAYLRRLVDATLAGVSALALQEGEEAEAASLREEGRAPPRGAAGGPDRRVRGRGRGCRCEASVVGRRGVRRPFAGEVGAYSATFTSFAFRVSFLVETLKPFPSVVRTTSVTSTSRRESARHFKASGTFA